MSTPLEITRRFEEQAAESRTKENVVRLSINDVGIFDDPAIPASIGQWLSNLSKAYEYHFPTFDPITGKWIHDFQFATMKDAALFKLMFHEFID